MPLIFSSMCSRMISIPIVKASTIRRTALYQPLAPAMTMAVSLPSSIRKMLAPAEANRSTFWNCSSTCRATRNEPMVSGEAAKRPQGSIIRGEGGREVSG